MTIYTLYWTRPDGQGDLLMGTFATEAQAWAAQPAALQELLEQCNDAAACEADILAGTWSVNPPRDDDA